MRFTSNAWGYVRAARRFTPSEIAAHIGSLGFDGFDLMIGPDATPALSLDDAVSDVRVIRHAAERAGSRIGALVFVGFPLHAPAVCERMFALAPELAEAAGTMNVCLLPRAVGISQAEGFRRLRSVWDTHGRFLPEGGIVVCAENHVLSESPDDDIFLIRRSEDFDRMLDLTSGGIKVKFDPAWLMKDGAREDPLPAMKRLVANIVILDLKDIHANRFVSPGTGDMPFDDIAAIAKEHEVTSVAVEVEEHHYMSPEPSDVSTIDALHRMSLAYYRQAFR